MLAESSVSVAIVHRAWLRRRLFKVGIPLEIWIKHRELLFLLLYRLDHSRCSCKAPPADRSYTVHFPVTFNL